MYMTNQCNFQHLISKSNVIEESNVLIEQRKYMKSTLGGSRNSAEKRKIEPMQEDEDKY